MKFSKVDKTKGAGRKGSSGGLSFRQLRSQKAPAIEKRKESFARSSALHRKAKRESDESRILLYRQATEYISQVLTAVRSGKAFSLESGIKIIEKIVKGNTTADPLFLKAIHTSKSYDFVISHPVNVAILAVKVAANLGFERKRQVEVGMVGLLHDVGMGRISEEVIYKTQELDEEEILILQDRPKFGYDVLRQVGEDYPFLAESALQVHETVDGSGYPRGLKVDEINEYAQIIGVVDLYEALIHDRPHRDRILHFYAVKEMIRIGKQKFQQRYLKALINTVSIFPLQSYVQLNSNAIGEVVETYQDQPMRPTLRILYDSQRKRVLTERFIDLTENSLLYIVDAVSEDDLLEISEESYLVTKPGTTDVEDSLESGTEKVVEGGEDVEEETAVEDPVTPGYEVTGFDGSEDDTEAQPSDETKDDAIKAAGDGTTDTHGEPAVSGLDDAETPMNTFTSGPSKTGRSSQAPPKKPKKKFSILRFFIMIAILMIGAHFGWQYMAQKAEDVPYPKIVRGRVKMPPPAKVQQPPLTAKKQSPAVSRPKPTPAVKKKPSVPSVPKVATTQSTPKAQQDPFAVSPKTSYPYSIKLPSFKFVGDARKSVDQYNDSGIDAYWVKVDLGDKGIWYRVFTGYFKSKEDAEAYIRNYNLTGHAIKTTRYTNWLGSYTDKFTLLKRRQEIAALGFSPYVVTEGNRSHLYVGAFYTYEGAEAQFKDLMDKNVTNRIIKR